MSRITRITAVHIILLLVGSLPCIEAREIDLDVLLERHADALGGRSAIGAVHTIEQTGEIEMPATGMRGTMTSVSHAPCLSYSEISLGLFSVRQGYDGARMWMVGPNGRLQIMEDGDSRRNLVTTCILEDFRYLCQADGFTLEYGGLVCSGPDSARFHLATLVPAGGYSCRLLIDPSSYLLAAVEVESMAGVIEHRFGDYREENGIMIPYRTVTTHGATGQTIETRVTGVVINGEVDPAIFLPPGDLVEDFSFASGGDSAAVAFRYINRHIYLPVRLKGADSELLFMLDSGAGMTLIDETLAGEMGLENGGTITGAGAAGMAEFDMTRIPGFSSGGVSFEEQTVIIYPIADLLSRHSGIEPGGVLGYDFLSRFVTRIDYGGRVITFYRPGSQPSVTGADTVSAPLYHKIFTALAVLEGEHEGTFILDTGANSSILNRAFAESNGLLEERNSAEIFIAGAGGRDRASLARFESLRIGDVLLEGPVLTIPMGGRGIGAFEGISGIIGNDILERFTLWLDYVGQIAVFERGGAGGGPFWPDRSGMQLAGTEGGSIEVRTVIPGSPAGRAGIRSGDIILRAGGLDASEENIESILLLLRGDEGDSVKIDYTRDGEKKSASVVLDSYI